MYSDEDLDSAVAAKIINPDAAIAFRHFISTQRSTSLADEEHFRLVTGFNDIFVVIACALLLISVGWIGSMIFPSLGALAVAGTSWACAEVFTRKRRLALPSIILLLAFVGSAFASVTVSGLENLQPG